MLVTSVLGFLKGIMLAKFLGVSGYGYVGLAEVVSTYGIYVLSLGLIHGLRREIPVMRASKRYLRLAWVLSNTMGHLLFHIAYCIFLYGALIAFLPVEIQIKQLLGLSGALSVAMTLFQYGSLQWNVEERYVAYAATNALKSLLVLAFALALGMTYGFQGAILGEIIGFVLVIALMLVLKRFHVPKLSHWLQHFHWQEKSFGRFNPMAKVNRIGLPLTIQAILRSSAGNLDKIAVGMALGVTALGYYNFSLILTAVGLITANLLGLYLSPKLCRWFTESAGLTYGKRVVHLCCWGLFFIGVLCYLPFVWLLTPGMERIFPEYLEAIPLMKWMFWGALFQIFTLYDHLFSASGKVQIYLKWNLIYTLCCFILYVLLVMFKQPLIAFPIAYVGLRLMYAVVVILMSHFCIHNELENPKIQTEQA